MKKKKKILKIKYNDVNNADYEVKRQTGFRSLKHLLAFTILLCNGDHDLMVKTNSKLTWLEEWYFYHTFIWGQTITRWCDVEAQMSSNQESLIIILKSKLNIALTCRRS